jgi:hypothetical protein
MILGHLLQFFERCFFLVTTFSCLLFLMTDGFSVFFLAFLTQLWNAV